MAVESNTLGLAERLMADTTVNVGGLMDQGIKVGATPVTRRLSGTDCLGNSPLGAKEVRRANSLTR